MFKFRFGVALFVSILLISGTLWLRFVHKDSVPAALAVVSTQDQVDTDQQAEANSAELKAEVAADIDTPPLNSTDLVSRQMIGDYLNLAETGQATDENVSALGDTYGASLLSLNATTPVSSKDLSVVADSKDSFQAYSTAIANIYEKYKALVATTLSSNKGLGEVGDASFITTMGTLGSLYARAADELKAVPVPVSLADDQVKWINAYLTNAHMLKALGGASTDAVSALAALSSGADVANDESDVLLSIRATLLTKGVFLSTQL